jgi:hypothetical protein
MGKPKNSFQLTAKAVLSVVAPVFAISVLIACSILVDLVVLPGQQIGVPAASAASSELSSERPLHMIFPGFFQVIRSQGLPLVISAIAALSITILSSIGVNVNRISLHGLYRNRLVRAFLGASNPHRNPNLFTDFDPNDDVPMASLFSTHSTHSPNGGCLATILHNQPDAQYNLVKKACVAGTQSGAVYG